MEMSNDKKIGDYTLISSEQAMISESPRSDPQAYSERRPGNMKGVASLPAHMQQNFNLSLNVQPLKQQGGKTLGFSAAPQTTPPMSFDTNFGPPTNAKPYQQRAAPKAVTRVSFKPPKTTGMEPKILSNPYKPTQSLFIDVPQTASDQGVKEHLQGTMDLVYQIMVSMTPNLSFKPNQKDLKCKGSYTDASAYATCNFEVQIWKVDPSVAKSDAPEREFILEFRNKGREARDAYRNLINIIASELKAAGRCSKFANHIEICGKDEGLFPESLQDLGELAPPMGSLAMPSMTYGMRAPAPTSKCPIQLNESQLDIWDKILESGKAPNCAYTLKLMAKCCEDSANRQKLSERKKLIKAVCSELETSVDPSSCHNSLLIASSLLKESTEALKVLVDHNILTAVANSLLMHSGQFKLGKTKTTRSAAIERIALNVLDDLIRSAMEDITHLNGALQTQVSKTLKVLQSDLSGKLKDQQHTTQLQSIIKGLSKMHRNH